MVKFSNKTLDDWNELANKELKNKVSNGEQNLSWESEEGIQIKALYTRTFKYNAWLSSFRKRT